MSPTNIAGAILAGGRGERIGGAKAMRRLLADPMIEHVAAVLRPTVDRLAVVGDLGAAEVIDAVHLRDEAGDQVGPLAGVLSALQWSARESAQWLVVVPCDMPLLPPNLVERLLDAVIDRDVATAYAQTPGGQHPLVSVWRAELALPLRSAMAGGHPAVRDMLARFGAVGVSFDDDRAFLNVNTPTDLAEAEELLLERVRVLSRQPLRSS
jgi:molybdopterin-guanine dinucleotide biosynthesis protein A